uniref:Ras-related protein Rab-7b n=1 Tax=Eutreptiella gymnastica TaxID=73025 RepID=A0A7S1IQP0_9EUGL|mmetsp:Transcript_349/g.825  ORF Transcript_349/g.825 Transcript_349/m.825 type:complete len:231 (+) Transcript_349:62-754(+)
MHKEKKRQKKVFKVVVLGDSSVGKTSLINRYVYEKFSGRYMATIGSDFHAKDIKIFDPVDREGRKIDVCLQIWDTAGQERFQSLGVAYYRGSDACLLVFDLTNEVSFQNLVSWMNEFLIQAQPQDVENFPIVVIGNKADLAKTDRKVTTRQVTDWCTKNGGLPYFECSAKENLDVESAFLRVADAVQARMCGVEDDDLFSPASVDPKRIHLQRKSVAAKQCSMGDLRCGS